MRLINADFLLEEIGNAWEYANPMTIIDLITNAPAQHINNDVLIFTKDSLQEHDNEVIENCAIVCENIITGDDAEFYTDAFAKAIREMKGK